MSRGNLVNSDYLPAPFLANEVTALLRLQVQEEVTKSMGKARDELEKFQKQSVSAEKQVKDLFRELAGPVAGIGIGAALGKFVSASLEAAGSLEALHRRAQVLFGADFPAMEQ